MADPTSRLERGSWSGLGSRCHAFWVCYVVCFRWANRVVRPTSPVAACPSLSFRFACGSLGPWGMELDQSPRASPPSNRIRKGSITLSDGVRSLNPCGDTIPRRPTDRPASSTPNMPERSRELSWEKSNGIKGVPRVVTRRSRSTTPPSHSSQPKLPEHNLGRGYRVRVSSSRRRQPHLLHGSAGVAVGMPSCMYKALQNTTFPRTQSPGPEQSGESFMQVSTSQAMRGR